MVDAATPVSYTHLAMRTMRKINKPIKFFGLSSGQFAIFMLLTAIIIIVSIFKQLHLSLIHILKAGIEPGHFYTTAEKSLCLLSRTIC